MAAVSVAVLALEVAVGLGAVCAWDGAAELFWGAAVVVNVSAITAAMEIAG